jgi:hypothetical protein
MNSKMIIQKDDQYINVYGEKYIEKIDFLNKLITEEETGVDTFKVVNLEAGLGKSFYTDIIIKHFLESEFWASRRFLLVKKFNDESYISAGRMKHSFFTDHVAVVTSETWEKEWKNNTEELRNKRVIIISHKRYIDLCEKDKEREVFTHKRHTLIVDEKVNFPIYTYSDGFYSEIRGIVSPHNRESIFDKACSPLNNLIEELKGSTACIRVHPEIDEKLFLEFEIMMMSEISKASNKHKRLLYDFLDTVTLCYDKNILAVINSGKICTLNRNHKHWGLKNNIILDASAGIDGVYQVNKTKYQLQRQTSFIDHCESTFTHINFKSSKSFITSNQTEFFNKMLGLIESRHKEDQKTLIVVHKKFATYLHNVMKQKFGDGNVWKEKSEKKFDSDYSNQQYAISWFGNLIGKNEYKDFDNVWIMGTPNIALNNYLVQYMQYTGETLGKKGLGVYKGKFKNDEFKVIQDGYIASEIYQSLKRIQRNANPKGNFYIVNSDEEIVKKAISPMKNARISDEHHIEIIDENAVKKVTKIDLIAEYIKSQVKELSDKAQIKKSDIVNLYGTIRWDRVKIHPTITELMVKGILREQARYFVVFKKRVIPSQKEVE